MVLRFFAVSMMCALPYATAVAQGQTTQSTTAATTEPIVADLASPKGAVKFLAEAMEAGDSERILEMLLASNPTEQRIADSMAAVAMALANLQKSAVAAFGEQGARALTGDTAAESIAVDRRIQAANVQIEGDRAVITLESSNEPPLVLIRVQEKWRYPIAELAKGADGPQVDERIQDMIVQAELLNELSQEVTAGKYKAAEEVRDVLQQRTMQSVMQPQTKATTGPATAPTTAP